MKYTKIYCTEKISQNTNKLENLNFVIRNLEIAETINKFKKDSTIFSELFKDKTFLKEIEMLDSFKDTSECAISMKLKRFVYDIQVYEFEALFTKCHGRLHCITGNDGDLQYIFICSECGTIIIDDHSDPYQYHAPSLLCPTCNKLKVDENGDTKYPYEYIPRDTKRWATHAFHYSYYVHKNLLTKPEFEKCLDEFCNGKFFKKFKIRRNFNKLINDDWKEMPYVAGEDMSNVELKYQEKPNVL